MRSSRRTRVHPLAIVLSSVLAVATIHTTAVADSQILDVVVHSRALEGNLLEDSPDRNVTIYLPPDYTASPDNRYPSVYLLHGITGSNKVWIGQGYLGPIDIQELADNLIDQGLIRPMIIVMPDAYNKYTGSWYLNSPVTGNWEDFIVRDLVEYVDSNYRTIPASVSRGVTGHSMGGYGSLVLATRYPNVFSAAYGMSPADPVQGWDLSATLYSGRNPDTGRPLILTAQDAWELALQAGSWGAVTGAMMDDNWIKGFLSAVHVAVGATASPNPDAQPFLVDMPFDLVDGVLTPIESVQQ